MWRRRREIFNYNMQIILLQRTKKGKRGYAMKKDAMELVAWDGKGAQIEIRRGWQITLQRYCIY